MGDLDFQTIAPLLRRAVDEHGAELAPEVRAAVENVLRDPTQLPHRCDLVAQVFAQPFAAQLFGDTVERARAVILGGGAVAAAVPTAQAVAVVAATGTDAAPVDLGYLDRGAFPDLDALTAELTAAAPQVDLGGYTGPGVTADMLRRFMTRYREITGGDIEWAPTVWRFLEQFGYVIDRVLDRPFRIGLSGFSAKDFDKPAVHRFFVALWTELVVLGIPADDIRVISGFTRVGVPAIAYNTADRALGQLLDGVGRELAKSGITSGAAIYELVQPVDSVAMVGTKWDGSEQNLYYSVTTHYLALGGGALTEDEIKDQLARDPDGVTLVQGFYERRKKDGQMVPGASDKFPSDAPYVVTGADKDPEEAARKAARRIAAHYFAQRQRERTPTLADLAMQLAPRGAGHVSVEAFERENYKKARILQLLQGIAQVMRKEGKPETEVEQTMTRLAAALILEIPSSVEDPKLWASAALTVLERLAPDVASLPVREPLYFASRIGAQTMASDVEVYDKTTTPIPKAVIDFDIHAPHPMEAESYLEKRYGVLLMTALKLFGNPTGDGQSRLDIFMGSRTELEAYYRQKGYRNFTHLTTNTSIHFIKVEGPDQPNRMIVYGISSYAKYVHTLLQFKFLGLDVAKINVRGSLDDYIQRSTDQLELALSRLSHPPRAVIMGSRWWPMELLAQMAGYQTAGFDYAYDKLKPNSIAVGPWQFDYVTVVDKEGSRSTLLAMRMPNGDLAERAARALVNAGTRIILTTGAGGSLKPDDEAGKLHVVTRSRHDSDSIDLGALEGVTSHSFNEAASAQTNVTVDSPLLEHLGWIEEARTTAGDVDVETFYIMRAIQQAVKSGVSLDVALHLFMSDVVGVNPLDHKISFDEVYGPHLKKTLEQFLARLGISTIEAGGKSYDLGLPAPVEPLLGRHAIPPAEQTSRRQVIDAKTAAGMLSTADYVGTTAQMQGEKRMMVVSAERFGDDDRKWFSDLLNNLSPNNFWIVTAASDKYHGDIISLAQGRGFETVLLVDQTGAFLARPDHLLSVNGNAGQTIRDLTTPNEENNARHFRVVIGKGDSPENLFSRHGITEEVSVSGATTARRLAIAMNQDYNEGYLRLQGALDAKLSRHVDLMDFGQIPSWLRGRRLVMFSGASKKAWPDIERAGKVEEVRSLLRDLLSRLDPDKVVIGTGATHHGFEKEVHVIAKEMGFKILGTPVEHSFNDEFFPDLDAVAYGGIAWFGKSRPLGKLLVQVGAEVISVGGGAIMKSELAMHHEMGVSIHAMEGPPGAAHDFASDHPQASFKDSNQLVSRLRERRPEIFRKDEPSSPPSSGSLTVLPVVAGGQVTAGPTGAGPTATVEAPPLGDDSGAPRAFSGDSSLMLGGSILGTAYTFDGSVAVQAAPVMVEEPVVIRRPIPLKLVPDEETTEPLPSGLKAKIVSLASRQGLDELARRVARLDERLIERLVRNGQKGCAHLLRRNGWNDQAATLEGLTLKGGQRVQLLLLSLALATKATGDAKKLTAGFLDVPAQMAGKGGVVGQTIGVSNAANPVLRAVVR